MKVRFGFRLSIVLLLFAVSSAVADETAPSMASASDELQVTIDIKPDADLYVKQAATIRLDILTPAWFSQEPKVQLPNQTDWVFAAAPIAKGPISTRVQGTSMSGIFMEIAAYPIRAGTLPLGPIQVTVKIGNPSEPNAPLVTWQSPPLSVQVEPLAGAANPDRFIVADSAEIEQTWEVEDPAIGDAVVRTITIKATGTQSMLIPPMDSPPSVSGVSFYPEQPELSDSASRGDLVATRRDVTTYILENQGRVHLPELQWQWFDTTNREIKTLSAEALTLDVKPGSHYPDAAATEQLSVQRVSPLWLAFIGLLLGGTFFCIYHYRARTEDLWNALQRSRRQRPRYRLKSVCQSVENDPPPGVLQQLYLWGDQLDPESRALLHHSSAWQQLQQASMGCAELNRAQLKKQVLIAYHAWQKVQTREEHAVLHPLYPTHPLYSTHPSRPNPK